MSVLEIVLYSLLGVGFITWLVLTVVAEKKKRNKKLTGENNDDTEEDQ